MTFLLQIFFAFFKIGLFTFGGGGAMFPLLVKEMTQFHYSTEDLIKKFSLAQTLPGVIALNTAVLIGYALHGIMGAFFAITGVVLPSYLVIVLILDFFSHAFSHPIMGAFFSGLRMAVAATILHSVLQLLTKTIDKSLKGLLLFSFLFLLTILILAFHINPAILILAVILLITMTFLLKKISHSKNLPSKNS